MRFILSFLPALLSAGLLALAIPNEWLHFGSGLIGLIALIPLYMGFFHARSRRQAAILNGFMVAFVHLFASFWLAFFKDFAIFTLGASTIAYFILALPFGVFFYSALKAKLPLRPFLFAAVWTLWEWFKSTGFLAYPWGTTFMTTMDFTTFIQIADITGVWGISFLIVLISAIFAEFVIAAMQHTHTIKPTGLSGLYYAARVAVVLIVCSLAYGAYRLAEPIQPAKTLTIGIVQENTDSWDSGAFEETLASLQARTKALISKAEKKPDLILWSEGSLQAPFEQNLEYYKHAPFTQPFTEFLEDINTPLLTGSPTPSNKTRGRYHNSVRLFTNPTVRPQSYAKIQLVCFAEYIPFIDHPLIKDFFDSIVGFSSGWEPGRELKTLTVTTKDNTDVSFAVPICFEDAFPPLCAALHEQGSELLINLTNDAWSKTVSAEYQHFTVAYFRTIELRTTLVRSTNTGYSVIVDPKGKILADLPLFTAAELVADVPVYPHTMTAYARYKDWFPISLCVLFIILGVHTILTRNKEKV